MNPAADDLDARRPVWQALSDMFLDADVTLTRERRAKVLAVSPYSAAELQTILIEEVYPICWSNLNAAQGEQQGFDLQRMEALILRRDPGSQTWARLIELARIAVPDSTEWQATLEALAGLRPAG